MARRPNAQQRRIEELLRTHEPAIANAFREAIQAARGAVDRRALIAALEAGNLERAVELLRINRALLFPLDESIRASFIAGGTMVATGLPRGAAAVFGFDGRHERAERWVRRQAGELIEGISEDVLQSTRAVVRDGLEAGRHPRSVARDIIGRLDRASGRRTGGIIGLNSNQTDAVIRAQSELLSGDPSQMRNYLTRQRRDRRFDALVRKALAEGRAVSQADAQRVTGRYSDRLLQLRGETIARTESITALRAGRHEGFSQLVESGVARDDQIERRWSATGDARTRPDHMAMNGETVRGMNEPFVMPDGTRMAYPGDPSAPADQTVNCRCFEVVRVRYIE